jgi:hypothetical protein
MDSKVPSVRLWDIPYQPRTHPFRQKPAGPYGQVVAEGIGDLRVRSGAPAGSFVAGVGGVAAWQVKMTEGPWMYLTRWIAAWLLMSTASCLAELGDTVSPSPDHPAIGYFNYRNHPLRDPVSELNRKLRQGAVQLRFEKGTGYLRSVLEALHVPVESQMVVFSKTSMQFARIEPGNPRTIFFNDAVAVAWVRGGFIELASHDPQMGVIFYSLEQEHGRKPEFQRRDECLRCHISEVSLGVPGMMVRGRFTAADGMPKLIYGGYATDHRSPLEERWGGWYVTGDAGKARHMGNAMLTGDEPESMVTDQTLHVKSLAGKFDTAAYLSPYSDIAALMVFDHQMYMTNLLIRVGWETRAALYDKRRDLAVRLREGARELVDYLLFVEEAPLAGRIQGTSGFAEQFVRQGPRDSRGRSLRELDLEKRLLRYPCSYMIYTEAFDSLPAEARAAIYQRMWQILSGAERGGKYARLSLPDRQAVVEILRETKKGLPEYFQAVTR